MLEKILAFLAGAIDLMLSATAKIVAGIVATFLIMAVIIATIITSIIYLVV